MTPFAEHNSPTAHPGPAERRALRIAVLLVVALLLAATAFLAGRSSAPASSHTAVSLATSATQCATPESLWSPVGVHWRLIVTFLVGPRKGQSEVSLMTFAPSGTLTATFPGAIPSDPPTLPPASNGRWCMTGPNAFHYQFQEVLDQAGLPNAIVVQTQVNALLTSTTSYEAGGVGVAYAGKNGGQPLPGQYNLTQTFASA